MANQYIMNIGEARKHWWNIDTYSGEIEVVAVNQSAAMQEVRSYLKAAGFNHYVVLSTRKVEN